jgi:hypothetical protein
LLLYSQPDLVSLFL